jgi:hypothetical protein
MRSSSQLENLGFSGYRYFVIPALSKLSILMGLLVFPSSFPAANAKKQIPCWTPMKESVACTRPSPHPRLQPMMLSQHSHDQLAENFGPLSSPRENHAADPVRSADLSQFLRSRKSLLMKTAPNDICLLRWKRPARPNARNRIVTLRRGSGRRSTGPFANDPEKSLL